MNSSTHGAGGWVGLRADLDALKDMKISCICQQSNHDSSILFTCFSLYRRYLMK